MNVKDVIGASNAISVLEMQSLIQTTTVHRRRQDVTTRLITIKKTNRKNMFRAIIKNNFFKGLRLK
jgi:hypothetical protein